VVEQRVIGYWLLELLLLQLPILGTIQIDPDGPGPAWAHNRAASLAQGDFRFSRDFSGMFENVPDNVFLVKASFWIPR
jgi:hypothetical protein